MAPKIQWIVDAYGTESLHTNEPSKSYAESYLGQLVRQGDDWYFQQKGTEKLEGPFKGYPAVKNAAVRLVGGEYVG